MQPSDASAWAGRILPRRLYRGLIPHAKRLLAWWWREDLNRLALLFGTDKWGAHWYTQHYQELFAWRCRQRLTLLELGVGGYADPAAGASSLRMWRAYFRRAQIVGIDIEDKRHFSGRRIAVRQCSQVDAPALHRLADEFGGFDVIIDDGSHRSEHIIASFEILFPRLRIGGVYAVEDVQTSYWPSWGGGMSHPASAMAYFKRLADGLNHCEYPILDYRPTYADLNIMSLTFFHNLIVVRKGDNSESSNVPAMVQRETATAASAPASFS